MDCNLLRELSLLNRKYHINSIQYHCDLLKQAPKEVVATIRDRKKWRRIRQLKMKHKEIPLSVVVQFVAYEHLIVKEKEK